jgi:hypothetical protein
MKKVSKKSTKKGTAVKATKKKVSGGKACQKQPGTNVVG